VWGATTPTESKSAFVAAVPLWSALNHALREALETAL